LTAAQFSWNVRVYSEDTDTAGVVYYANYLRFFERARTEWLRHLGLNQEKLAAEEGLRFVVRRATLDFIAAARLDDLLQISVRILKLAGASLELEQEACNEGRRICAATVKVACLRDADFRPVPIPESIRARMHP
jgi:acyl-CoA thioester hydrolase